VFCGSSAQTRCGCDIQIRTVCQRTECLVCWMSFVCEQENVSVQSQLFICFLLSFFVLLYTTFFISRTVFENVQSMFSSQVETQIIYTDAIKSHQQIFISISQLEKTIFWNSYLFLSEYKIYYTIIPFYIADIFLSAHWNMRRANTKNVCLRLRRAVDSQIFVRAFSQKCNNHKCWLDKNAARKQSERYFDACGEKSARTWKKSHMWSSRSFTWGIKMHHYVVVCGVCQ
jgi:hypothetical protein